ncbi:MAG: hypothetical protein JJ863_10645 [Deltaproteobacteria bacterium]|nr:hypothetical protein [Deltaproteobacteria bacterium]
MSDEDETEAEPADDASEAPTHRVKGEAHQGAIPAKELVRIIIIGIPVMIAAWYFLLWMKGGFR